jgi:hypothetical protein
MTRPDPRDAQTEQRRPAATGNAPLVRRVIVVMIAFLAVSMAGMLALGIALYRS